MGFFDFGKKRRVKRRSTKKGSRKPPSKLLRICKKYRVKATKKVGGKRVYKSVASLKKMCLRKARALRKKLMKAQKRSMKKSGGRRRKTYRRRSDFGEEGEMEFGRRRRSGFGNMNGMMMPGMETGMGFGEGMMDRLKARMGGMSDFGKRRRTGRSTRVSKKHAMKAFRSFYKRHCAGRRSGFGSNPPLSQSMGYSFCPDGMGGVLGPYSTGLYATPCQSPSSSFGRRRRRSASSFGARCRKGYRRSKTGKSRCVRSTRRRVTRRKTVRKSRRRYNVAGSPCNIKKRADCRSNPNCTYTRRGCRRRSGTKTGGLRYSGPMLPAAARAASTATAYGRRRRRRRAFGGGPSDEDMAAIRARPMSVKEMAKRRRRRSRFGEVPSWIKY